MKKKRLLGPSRKLARLREKDAARTDAAWAELERWISQKIGASPRARLRWFVEGFLRADLAEATDDEWGQWRILLDGFAIRGAYRWLTPPPAAEEPEAEIIFDFLHDLATAQYARAVEGIPIRKFRWKATADEREEIATCQELSREIFGGLARGRLCSADLGKVRLFCQIGREELAEKGPRALVRHFEASRLAGTLLVALDHLAVVGANRLRVCPFQERWPLVMVAGEEGCGQLFLAAKGQRYCSPEHTRRAMYLKWKQRAHPGRTRPKGGGIG